MIFNSYNFILIFLPISVFGYFLINKLKMGNKLIYLYIIIINLIFYGLFNIKYVPLLLVCVSMNYGISEIYRKFYKNKKTFLILGLTLNILLLCYFKYSNFFIEIFKLTGSGFQPLQLIVPLGISFFTFQQISYIIDCYRDENIKYSFLQYLAYSSFFPCIIQGPISYHHEIIPQLTNTKFNSENFLKGIYSFTIGLAKKVLLADVLGSIASVGFASISSLNSTNAIICMFAYTLQIYFDFSGYTDMSIGIGYLFNVKIPENFNSPYKATNINDFWNRWHITLTRFFTKYIYISLGGNRRGNFKTYRNVFIVFFISGLWHGANYTFILWGIMHGIASIIDKIVAKKSKCRNEIFGWICTFLFVNIAWVFFRADNVMDAFRFIYHILRFDFGPIDAVILEVCKFPLVSVILNVGSLNRLFTYFPYFYFQILFVISFIIILKTKSTNEQLKEFKMNYLKCIAIGVLLWISIISITGYSTFIYTNF